MTSPLWTYLAGVLWEYKDVIWELQRDWRRLYHVWSIPKRGGGRRWIHAPQGRLKQLQRELLPILLNYPLHKAARAYIPGTGSHVDVTKEHQKFSKGEAWFFEADIKDFFGHVTRKMLRQKGLPPVVINAITILHPHNGWVLPQGGVTSPPASNLVLNEFDQELSAALPEDSLYTRYADNLGISIRTNMNRRELYNFLTRLVTRVMHKHGFKPNCDKFKLVPPGEGQVYLGVNLSGDQLKLTRKFAVQKLRSKMHHLRMGDTTEASAKGMINYLKHVNPQQYKKEKNRHGFTD